MMRRVNKIIQRRKHSRVVPKPVDVEQALESIVITEEEGTKKDALPELLKLRYGDEWQRHLPPAYGQT